jgi:hypothetical protein
MFLKKDSKATSICGLPYDEGPDCGILGYVTVSPGWMEPMFRGNTSLPY